MRYQWGMGGYHSNYTISFLLAWLSLPLRTATSSNWVERYSIIQRPKNLAWTYLHCRRLVISDALVSSMDAQLLCFPTRICGSVSAPLEVAHVAGRLSSDCLRSLCCCYLDLLQLYAVCQLYIATSKRPHEAMVDPYGRWIILVFPPVLHG